MKVEMDVPVPNSPYGLSGRKATLKKKLVPSAVKQKPKLFQITGLWAVCSFYTFVSTSGMRVC